MKRKLRATADGFLPACSSLTSATSDKLLIHFDLTPATDETTFSLSGTVQVPNAAADQSVALTFYQTIECKDETTATVVVRELNIAAAADGVFSYEISLPAGDYDIVATTEDKTDIELDITLGADLVQNIEFL